ncbi:hypothetical protein OG21DRAFT_1483315 [Imleria badia]|nr:hypothetical protein OG21DRAFT_1483315 [Imleria badia]
MVVLPGGKYMIASVCNVARAHCSLVVFALDHRVGGVAPCTHPQPHNIRNIRVLPYQGQVPVVCAAKLPTIPNADSDRGAPPLSQHLITIAMLDIPDFGNNEMQGRFAEQTMSFRADEVEGMQTTDLSDYGSITYANPANDAKHPPIAIFYRSEGNSTSS